MSRKPWSIHFVGTTIAQFKGAPAPSVVFFDGAGSGAPAIGGTYLLFLTAGQARGFGMNSTNSYSEAAHAMFRRTCSALRQGFEPLPVYGIVGADWNLVTDGMALKVQERYVQFPGSVPRAGTDQDFGETDRLYDARWIPVDPAFAYLRTLQRAAEPDAVVRRDFLHLRGEAALVLQDPIYLQDLIEHESGVAGAEREEQIELIGRALLKWPEAYLQANRTRPDCFAIDIPSWRASEDGTWAEERTLRRAALLGVADPALRETRDRCVAELAD